MPAELEGTWYTTAEAARELGLSHDAVRNAVHRGALQVRQVTPRLNMVNAAEVDRYRRESLGRPGPRPGTPRPRRAGTPDG